MYLKKIEIQGFKTFANKTSLVFPAPKKTYAPITCIVGPNGSGKSNVADAMRWALGEQSLKLLRGKRSEDVIFSGSKGRARSGFAEVVLVFDNQDKTMPIDFSEISITRRLYRDGNSEYHLNGNAVRLADIHLLLAQANVGQRSYSVIGQGMIDNILASTPEERKSFFDDATGVKQFQIKRHSALLKLKRTHENISEVEMLLREIEPRLRSLKRQVSRLEKRSAVENELRDIQKRYYGTKWWQLQDQLKNIQISFSTIDTNVKQAQKEMNEMETKVSKMEEEEQQGGETDEGLTKQQQAYLALQKNRNKLRDKEFDIKREIELTKVRAQSNWAPLPLAKIVTEVETIAAKQKTLAEALKKNPNEKELDELAKEASLLFISSDKLLGKLKRPRPDQIKSDPKLVKEQDNLNKERHALEDELKALEDTINKEAHVAKKTRGELFELQRALRTKQHELHALENKRNEVQIDLARLEEREHNLARTIDTELKQSAIGVKTKRLKKFEDIEKLAPELERVKYKLELIGGIDPEVVKEFGETNERYEFLNGQVKDLQSAIQSTEKIIDELDDEIKKQSEKAFKKINNEFQRFFKLLFGGGTCALVKLSKEDVEEETKVNLDRAMEDTGGEERAHEEEEIEVLRKKKKEKNRVVGIDIQATPPGKRLKSLNLLSGGERALTSIALVSAIMAVNPSPFVVLDEVDAALDEANTLRFAMILEELQKHSQFIVITHNRATMEKSDVLYGVTMANDGVSNLLSVNLEDIAENGTSRR